MLHITSFTYAQDIYINNEGELYINNNKNWLFKDFKNYGYNISIDYKIYLSEGILSESKDNYYVLVSKNEIAIALFEIIDNAIWRGKVIDSEIPIRVNNKNNFTNLGISLSEAKKYFGSFNDLGQGDDVGSFLEFEKLNNSILHTHCAFFELEQTEEEKNMTKEQLLNHCKIDKILFFGNKRKIQQDEF